MFLPLTPRIMRCMPAENVPVALRISMQPVTSSTVAIMLALSTKPLWMDVKKLSMPTGELSV